MRPMQKVMVTEGPGDAGQDNTSAKGRGHQLLRAVGKLQQDEQVHCAYLVEKIKLRMNILIRVQIL